MSPTHPRQLFQHPAAFPSSTPRFPASCRVAALLLAALAVTPGFAVTVHRSFRGGYPVTPSTSPNARNYGNSYTGGAGMITRRDATPPFDFFANGRFAIAGVHLQDQRREVVSAAPKAGVKNIQERVIEEKDGQPLVKEMILLGAPDKGILVGRTGPQGGNQTEYRVGQVSTLLRGDRVQQMQASFIGDKELLAKYRDWMVPLLNKKCGRNPSNTEIIPKDGFGAEPDLPRSNVWKWSGITIELKYEPTPSRLILTAHR